MQFFLYSSEANLPLVCQIYWLSSLLLELREDRGAFSLEGNIRFHNKLTSSTVSKG